MIIIEASRERQEGERNNIASEYNSRNHPFSIRTENRFIGINIYHGKLSPFEKNFIKKTTIIPQFKRRTRNRQLL